MPRQKDLKRLARARMKKTGESYTTARKQLVTKKRPSLLPENYIDLAGMSDDAVRAKTGKTWKQWTRILDSVDAGAWPHREIAKYLLDQHDVTAWWAQTVTVAYERFRGLRDVGQRRGGKYDAGKSRTFAVPVSRLYRMFSVARSRGRWLPGVKLTVRTSQPDKSLRATWHDGTSVEFYFVSKGPSKSQVAIQHRHLDKKSAVSAAKAFWTERLDVLGELLAKRKR